MSIKIGDTVRLASHIKPGVIPKSRQDNKTATVKSMLGTMDGGVYLDRDLRGARYWHLEDLVKVIK